MAQSLTSCTGVSPSHVAVRNVDVLHCAMRSPRPQVRRLIQLHIRCTPTSLQHPSIQRVLPTEPVLTFERPVWYTQPLLHGVTPNGYLLCSVLNAPPLTLPTADGASLPRTSIKGTATATDAIPLHMMLDSQPPPHGKHRPFDTFGVSVCASRVAATLMLV